MTVSDFGISGPGWQGDEGIPRDDDPRYKLSELVRRINSLVVAAPIEDAALNSATAKLEEVVAGLESSAGPGRRPRVHPDSRGPAEDFFPTSPVIGFANPIAPPVEVESVEGGLNGRVFFDDQYEGPPGCVHGGIIALVFDELLGAANIACNSPGMTGTLTVRYRKPTPIRTNLRLAARFEGREGRKIRTTGAMYHGDELTAEAEAIFIELVADRFFAQMAKLDKKWSASSFENHGQAISAEMETLFGTILDASPDMLCLLDVDGTILRVSGAQEVILGYPAGELSGRSLLELVHPDDSLLVRGALQRVADRDATRFDVRYRLARQDGVWTPVATRGRAVLDDVDRPIAIVAASRDVTGDVQAEQKLLLAVSTAEQASQAKSEFLSRMSHELRTPLNSVLGFAELLEMDELSPSQEEAVADILRAGRHLLGLIDEVLDIARIEMGHLELTMEPVDLLALVNDAVGLTSPLAARAEVSVSVVGSLDPRACVHADRQRLLQVLLNLLSNACKYNSSGGKVRVTCEALRAGYIGVAVSDTGVGIREEDMPRLFEPFERLGAEQIGIEGAGVGLSIAKNLVERMGGVLDVFSKVGEGSTFEVVLKEAPTPTEPANRPAQQVDDLTLTQSTCVLLIEDNLANLTLIENLLTRRSDVRLLAAMHGTLGIDLAREHRPDLVLLDLHLPDQTGAEVLRRLQSDPVTAGIPVVVVSADRSSDQEHAMRELGAVDYLIKPFDVRDLLRAVDSALGNPDRPTL